MKRPYFNVPENDPVYGDHHPEAGPQEAVFAASPLEQRAVTVEDMDELIFAIDPDYAQYERDGDQQQILEIDRNYVREWLDKLYIPHE